jgi:hypothetical protein
VHLESHATPTQETPEQRRVSLHRAIDRGLESDELWKELAEVNLALGHDDEAIRCCRRIGGQAIRNVVASLMQRRGLISEAEERELAQLPGQPSGRGRDPRPADGQERDAEGATLREHVADAVQFLFMQHMPWLCLLTTLAFPLIVGLGGFLTAGTSPLVLAAIAAVPGICVLAVVGAMGRRILINSQEGIHDVPELGAPGQLARDALRFLKDALLVASVLLLPSLVALKLGTSVLSAVPPLLFGMFLLPMAWSLRQIRGDVGALSPVTLLRGVARGGSSYAAVTLLCWAMFVPAGSAAWIVQGKDLWVHIAAIGPMMVLPLFVASRLLGTWFDAQRLELAVVVGKTQVKVSGEQPPARPAKPAPQRRPGAPRPAAPRVGAPAKTAAPRPAAPKRAPVVGPKAPAAAAPAARRAAAPAATSKPAAPAPQARHAAEAEPQLRAIEGRSPRRPALTDAPDLSAMPGAVVVSGHERVRQGAAARPK